MSATHFTDSTAGTAANTGTGTGTDAAAAADTHAVNHHRYRARLDRVVDHIHAHLDEDLRIETLAEVAHLSPYHWHRIYTAMRGEAVATTVRRLRLQRAADRLANSEKPIKEIAAQAGFSATESFSRAFRDAYDQPPAQYREAGSHTRFMTASAADDAHGFDVVVRRIDAVRCAAVAHSGSYMQIDRAFATLFGGLASQQLLPPNARMIASFIDDPDLVAVDSLRSFACVPCDADRESFAAPLEGRTLAGGLHACLRYQGPYADMRNAYRWLYGTWLPGSGYLPADAPAVEEYLNDPREVAATDLLTDIRIPLLEAA